MPRPGFEPGILWPQRSVLTTRPPKRFTFLKFFLQCCSFFFTLLCERPFFMDRSNQCHSQNAILVSDWFTHTCPSCHVTFQPITDLPPAFCFLIGPFLMGPVSKGRDPVICITPTMFQGHATRRNSFPQGHSEKPSKPVPQTPETGDSRVG